MQEEEDTQIILDPVFLTQWPGPRSLNLQNTYDELRRLDNLGHLSAVGNFQKKQSDDTEVACQEDAESHVSPPSATHRMQMQRDDLRAPALPSSRSLISPPHIFNLPDEIMHEILSYLQGFDTSALSKLPLREIIQLANYGDQRIQNIQSTRLVCRRLNDLASPYLFPYVSVDLEPASLSRLENISKAPHLAKGVFGLLVGLQYRMAELAEDLQTFKSQRSLDLKRWLAACRVAARPRDWRLRTNEERRDRHEALKAATRNRLEIDHAWNTSFVAGGLTPKYEAYRRILAMGHEEFRRLHDEQASLITGGSFLRVVAESVARMPSSGNVVLTDAMTSRKYLQHGRDGTIVLDDPDKLAEYITYPLSWTQIEHCEDPRTNRDDAQNLLPARLLSQLPIAIDQAGVTLRHLEMNCLPSLGSYHLLCPGEGYSDEPAWDRFRQACQNLKSFTIKPEVCPMRKYGDEAPLRGGEFVRDLGSDGRWLSKRWQPKQNLLNKFLAAPLSSQLLGAVKLDFEELRLRDVDTARNVYLPLGPALSQVKWPIIQNMSVKFVSLSEAEFESFCEGLGDTLHTAAIERWLLKEGRWSSALQMLRAKILAGRPEQKRRVRFNYIEGGEFGTMEAESLSEGPLRWATYSCEEQPLLVQLSAQYLSGEIGTNPLVGLEMKNPTVGRYIG